ncbi:ribosomal protein L7/L12 [Shimazuella kribbensis]|uniref:ribosomal protein L7/L12 n=1 Tax=Shimazuella kribbensis TaxID=139808 RepID=UPI00056C384C|nr:ribosomal protein L7/L12 [Shimazuella kribbensis]
MDLWKFLILISLLLILFLAFTYTRHRQTQRIEQRLVRIERLLCLLGNHLKIEIEKVTDKDMEILKLALQGRKILAIKRTREMYGYGLKEAKNHVDELERKVNAL